ncbi:HEAT repeat domain-containing protein [Spongiimicrobium salis]|uniref:HEAT repeat domain-containing protein n=1 Tax=Spongiimicrobium salis TaxID=1667022 RepID=UPI00374CC5E1
MGFYDLSKEAREQLVEKINRELHEDIAAQSQQYLLLYFSDEDTYIRKTAYLAIGRLYKAQPKRRMAILKVLGKLLRADLEKIRQTVVNAAGEIGMLHFKEVQAFFDTALFDSHHTVRNAVIGSVKKMSAKNPVPVLAWAKTYLEHPNKEIRREICHGIELRGRTHPQDILPLLAQLQFDATARVRNTLIHVLGQIAYKKGCLETVMEALKYWENKALVAAAIDEIIDVHHRYRSFSHYTQEQAIAYIDRVNILKKK